MKRLKKLISNEKGLTLIELIASITILSIVIITFLSFFTNAFRFNSINDDSLQTMNIVREQQALIKAIDGEPWSYITTEFTKDPENPRYYIKQLNDAEHPEYVIKISIKETKETGEFYRDLHQVHIQVTKDGKILSETYRYHEGEISNP